MKTKKPRARTRSNQRASYKDKRAAAKALIGRNDKQDDADSEETECQRMLLIYDAILRLYNKKHFVTVAHKGMSTPMRSKMRVAVSMATDLGVSFETFVKAQFYCFDKWYSRNPKPHEICTPKAPGRVETYLREVDSGVTSKDRTVTSKVMAAPKISKDVKFASSERQLRTLMKNWNLSEEDVFRKFATGLYVFQYFDREWLRQNATYQRLKAAGEV